MAEVSQETKQFCPKCKTVPMQFRDNRGSSEWVCPQCQAILVRELGTRITRDFLVEGYLSDDGGCFYIHASERIYPDQWFDHLDVGKKWRFRIHIDAEEVEAKRG